LLSPREAAARAAANGVELFSLTDHDVTSGLDDARAEAKERGLRFVDGVEISVTWRGATVHILGLRIDPWSAALREGLESIRQGRGKRARRIAEGLDAAGIEGSLEGAQRYADNPDLISRAHFARFLVETGRAPDVKNVFQRYLVKDRPGWVSHQWASLPDAVGWIRGAGGVAVIAHPGRYKYERPEMREFFTEFKDCGGAGIEIVTGAHTPEQYHEFAKSAREFGFLASRGSDYHGKGESHADLGTLPPLPDGLKPVWHDW
jgi:predicted metal-dependent phosphoesterase TrpH